MLRKAADDLSVANGRDVDVTTIKVWSGYRATSQHRGGTRLDNTLIRTNEEL